MSVGFAGGRIRPLKYDPRRPVIVLGGSLLSVFASSVLPPLAIASVGYVLGRIRSVDVGPLSTVVLYVLLPALVFHSLVTSSVGGDTVASLAAGMVGFTLVMMVVAALIGRSLGETGDTFGGFVLTSAFPNAGNFGIPVATFAFGAVGRDTAVLFVVVQNVLLYTLGIAIVSRGGASEGEESGESAASGGAETAVRRILSMPVMYAVVAAGATVALGVPFPAEGTASRTLELVGNASIPLFLLILGLRLAEMNPAAAVSRSLPAVGLKLLAAPLVGAAVAVAVGIADPTAARAFVLLCAGPAAISPLVLLIEFGGETSEGLSGPDYVGSVIFATLVGSIPAVTIVLALLTSGAVF